MDPPAMGNQLVEKVDGEKPNWKKKIPDPAKQAKITEMFPDKYSWTRRLEPDRAELMWAEPEWLCVSLIEKVVKEGQLYDFGEEDSLKVLVECKYNAKKAIDVMKERSLLKKSLRQQPKRSCKKRSKVM